VEAVYTGWINCLSFFLLIVVLNCRTIETISKKAKVIKQLVKSTSAAVCGLDVTAFVASSGLGIFTGNAGM
jgi:hypothetical protein